MLGVMGGKDAIDHALGPASREIAVYLDHRDFGGHQLGTVNLNFVIALGAGWNASKNQHAQ